MGSKMNNALQQKISKKTDRRRAMKRIILLAFVLSLLALSGEVITLDQARDRALQFNPDYQAQTHTYKAAQWTEIQSITSLIGDASFSLGQSKTEPGALTDETNMQNYGYSFTQPIFMGGKLVLGWQISRDSKKMEEYTLLSTRLQTLSSVEQKYFSALEAQDYLEIARDQLKSATTNQEIAQVRYDLGTLSMADLLKIQADKATKETELIQAETAHKIALLSLKNYLQLSEDIQLQPIDTASYEPRIQTLSSMDESIMKTTITKVLDRGGKDNPTLLSLERSKKIADKNFYMAVGNVLPTVSFSLSKTWSKLWDETLEADDVDFDDQQTMSLNLSIPIFPLADNAANIAKVRHQRRATYLRYDSSKDGVYLQLEQSVLNLISAAKQKKAAELSLQYTDEMYRQMEERFRNGLITTTDLLDVQVMLKSAKTSYTRSIYQFITAKSALMNLLGIEDETILYTTLNI